MHHNTQCGAYVVERDCVHIAEVVSNHDAGRDCLDPFKVNLVDRKAGGVLPVSDLEPECLCPLA